MGDGEGSFEFSYEDWILLGVGLEKSYRAVQSKNACNNDQRSDIDSQNNEILAYHFHLKVSNEHIRFPNFKLGTTPILIIWMLCGILLLILAKEMYETLIFRYEV